MKFTIDEEIQNAVATIMQRGVSIGADLRADVICANEPLNSNTLDPKTLNFDERAIWEHGHAAGYDEALADLENADPDSVEDDEEAVTIYNDGYEEGRNAGYAEGRLESINDQEEQEAEAYEEGRVDMKLRIEEFLADEE